MNSSATSNRFGVLTNNCDDKYTIRHSACASASKYKKRFYNGDISASVAAAEYQKNFPDVLSPSSTTSTTSSKPIDYSVDEVKNNNIVKEDDDCDNDNDAYTGPTEQDEFNARAIRMIGYVVDRYDRRAEEYDGIHGEGAYVDMYGEFNSPVESDTDSDRGEM